MLNKTKSLLQAVQDEKELKKLSRIPLGESELIMLNDTICRQASEIVIKNNTLESCLQFLSYYQNCPESYKKVIILQRNQLAFKKACGENTLSSFDFFLKTYPDASQMKVATSKRDSAAFEIARQEDLIPAYQNFISVYPEAIQVQAAKSRIHEIAFEKTLAINTASAFEEFLKSYPESKQNKLADELMEKCQYNECIKPGEWKSYAEFLDKYPKSGWIPAAKDSLFEIAMRNVDVEALTYCKNNMSGDKHNEAFQALEEIAAKEKIREAEALQAQKMTGIQPDENANLNMLGLYLYGKSWNDKDLMDCKKLTLLSVKTKMVRVINFDYCDATGGTMSYGIAKINGNIISGMMSSPYQEGEGDNLPVMVDTTAFDLFVSSDLSKINYSAYDLNGKETLEEALLLELKYSFSGQQIILRDKPQIKGTVLAKLNPEKDKIELLEIGDFQINGKEPEKYNVWLKVKVNNKTGWIFGGLTL
jgi:outer membrane protein assembly factor BamD (BamD/ComL family)